MLLSSGSGHGLLTPEELAAQLGVDVAHLKQLRDEERGPAYIELTSRTIRYLSSEVADWLTEDGKPPTT